MQMLKPKLMPTLWCKLTVSQPENMCQQTALVCPCPRWRSQQHQRCRVRQKARSSGEKPHSLDKAQPQLKELEIIPVFNCSGSWDFSLSFRYSSVRCSADMGWLQVCEMGGKQIEGNEQGNSSPQASCRTVLTGRWAGHSLPVSACLCQWPGCWENHMQMCFPLSKTTDYPCWCPLNQSDSEILRNFSSALFMF